MTLGACNARLAPLTRDAPGTSTSAFSLRTSTTARRTGTTQSGWYEAFRTRARSKLRSHRQAGDVTEYNGEHQAQSDVEDPPAIRWTSGVVPEPVAGAAGGGARDEDAERGTAAGAVVDPGAAAVQLGEAGHHRQADADPGSVGRDLRAPAERLEDAVTQLRRDPWAGVLDREQHPVALTPQPHPHGGVRVGVTGRVGEQVLDDALDLAGVQRHRRRLGVQVHLAALQQAPLLGDPLHQGGDVAGAALGRDDPAAQPVQVEQVGE